MCRKGYVAHMHNSHARATENSHATRIFQQRFCKNVWSSFVNYYLIDPYLWPTRFNGHSYWIFLKEVSPELLQAIPIGVHNQMRFQHDGAPNYFSMEVCNYVDATFGMFWIGSRGSVR
ncbi:uncharacterized protein TNCV_153331 [Trichonephila clavipes]|nr:uncharacterized protein TNCV_153331 [Trichonephila clavipes]